MLLYAFTITPNNRKVVAFIRHYDLDIEVRQISFKDQEQKTEAFLEINPMGRVPVLVDGDFKLWEGNAILTYMARKFPETNALATDTRGRADADRWLHWQSAHLMPMMGALKTGAEEDPEAIKPLFDVLEGQLADRDFLLGDLGVCDFAIAAYLITKMASKMDYAGHPRLKAWRERAAGLKGFVETEMRRAPQSPT